MEDAHAVVVGLHRQGGLCILLNLTDDLRSGYGGELKVGLGGARWAGRTLEGIAGEAVRCEWVACHHWWIFVGSWDM